MTSLVLKRIFGWFPLAFAGLAACGGDPEAQAILDVKATVTDGLAAMRTGAVDLRAAAPAPAADGWGPAPDLAASKAAWRATRDAYERMEGAIAVLFPDLDASTDERYDGFLADGPDLDLFDGEGVIGVHAVERILWSDAHPASVVAFESGLDGYQPARFPASEAEAVAYRDALVGRLVDDVGAMDEAFAPLALDGAAAFEGVLGSMAEQVEKVAFSATGEDESRYAQYTLADMRSNIAGGREIYAAFSPWIASEGDADADVAVHAGFDRLAAAYGELAGDALPPVPAGWNPDAPAAAHLDTPYGRLWLAVQAESDPAVAGSLVADMVRAAASVGLAVSP